MDIIKAVEEAIETDQSWLVHEGARPGHEYQIDWRRIFVYENGTFGHPRPPGYRDLGHFLSEHGYTVEGYMICLRVDMLPLVIPPPPQPRAETLVAARGG